MCANRSVMDLSSVTPFAVGVVIVAAYELRQHLVTRRGLRSSARAAHSALRGEWVRALSRQAGTEILAVQTLRNSLMSATITASTAVLVLVSSFNLLASRAIENRSLLSTRYLLELGLGTSLFAAFVCSVIAMRYYHHAGFIMSLPVGTPERAAREEVAIAYVQRAGILYSWSLRCFLFAAPLGAGLMHAWLMPVAALGLTIVLTYFDRTPVGLEP
jgi:hypothetical protein